MPQPTPTPDAAVELRSRSSRYRQAQQTERDCAAQMARAQYRHTVALQELAAAVDDLLAESPQQTLLAALQRPAG